MSQEKLQAFAEALSKSEELQKRFASIQVEAVKSTAEKLAKLSESAGTPFTAEERTGLGDRSTVSRHQNRKKQFTAPDDYTSVLAKLRCPRFEERKDAGGRRNRT
jgi:hypothetical protein